MWITGYVLALYAEPSWLSLKVSVLLLGALVVIYVLRIPGRLPLCALLLVGVACGYYHWNDQRNVSALLPLAEQQERLDGSDITLTGRIASPVSVDGDRASFAVKAESIRFQHATDAFSLGGESVQVSLRLLKQAQQKQAASWRRGDTISLDGMLRSPSPARNFGGFDYRRYLRLHHTHWLLTAKGTEQAQVEPAGFRVNFVQLLRWNDELRDALSKRMDQIFPASQAGFMKSMLIGMQDDLDPERFQQFSELGLTHILAISGLNVAVFLGVCMWIMRRLKLARETYLLISMLLLPVYILLTGASPSIVRAGLMAMVALYAARRGLLKDVLHIIAIVAWVMLLWEPYYLLDVSFQLSFLVTLGLIIGVQRVNDLLQGSISLQFIRNTLSITVVSQLISFPVSIYYFNQFSLLSWAANAILVPVISMIVFPMGLLALVLGLINISAGRSMGWLLTWLNDAVFWITDRLEQLRGFKMIWPSPSLTWIVAFYLLLVLIYLSLHKNYQNLSMHHSILLESSSLKRRYVQASLLCSVLCFIILLWIGYAPNRLERSGLVQFIDVGQGDSILIRTPYGKHLLIDGGGTVTFQRQGEAWKQRKDPYEVGRKMLVPLLKKRGVHALDFLVLTHEDADHSGGLQAVVEQIPIKRFLFNGTYKPGKSVEKLFTTALNRKIPLVTAESNKWIEIDPDTKLQVLYPLSDGDHASQIDIVKEQNGQSIVFLLEMQGTRWLFTGDMEKNSEEVLLENLKSNIDRGQGVYSKIDVLKVAHHGSKTSTISSWLDYWKPSLGVISVGQNNLYGHPAPDVVQRLKQNGVRVFRTDEMGEIQFEVRQGIILNRTRIHYYFPSS
ncbi:DNA internalization-related competence protein ComEC/Rec2 [Paenibacillus sp. SYP-B3998]|uniref:DNA internalization-related competence protein ComEC/Rec2 n=1 Tax=Paenibacillus sp. SYP-B3998 TaxID=2678564 RepID=A0A6G3ZSW1_9BACL|nr:DNA internalization-related competence protein ComEC/Rec2 [Paenibacillus sp. SYP-B3998]